MNQEQNNLGQTNFKVQGNNEMSINQPLSNKSSNQSIDITQQQISSQPQSTPSFQHQIIQYSTPEHINNFENENSNVKSTKKTNLCLIIGLVIIVSIIIIGIFFRTKFPNKNNVNLKPNNNGNNIIDNSDNNNVSPNINNNDLTYKEYNRFFSINDTITSKNNYFEYTNYKWDFLNEDIDGVSIWQGTIKNISNKNLKGNLRLKFYDLNKKIIGEVQRFDLEDEVDPYNIFVLKPGDESKLSFSYYSDDLNEGYDLQDVKYISIEDIK